MIDHDVGMIAEPRVHVRFERGKVRRSITRLHGEDLASRFHPWRRGASVREGRFGHGRPVVMCHGTPWSSFVWRTTVEALVNHHTVYVWDMIGYGQSDKPDTDVSLQTQGELLAALVDEWDLQSPDVVAHDYGGAVVLRAHLLHGLALRSLALIDAVALRPWGSPFFQLVRQHSEVFSALPANLH